MEQYLEVLAFANDLIKYVGSKSGLELEDVLGQTEELSDMSPFHEAVGLAVWGLIESDPGRNLESINRELAERLAVQSSDLFCMLAIRAAVEYFPKGYGHCELFAYCAAVVGAAMSLYRQGGGTDIDEMIFEEAAGVLSTVLTGHVVVSGFDCSEKAWREMAEMAERFNAHNGFRDKE